MVGGHQCMLAAGSMRCYIAPSLFPSLHPAPPPHLDQPLAAAGREQLGKQGRCVGDLGDEAPIQLHYHSVQAGQRRLAAAAAAQDGGAAAGGQRRLLRRPEHVEHAAAQPLVHGAQLCRGAGWGGGGRRGADAGAQRGQDLHAGLLCCKPRQAGNRCCCSSSSMLPLHKPLYTPADQHLRG